MQVKDFRQLGQAAPIARVGFDQVSWLTSAGHAAKTTTRKGVNMLIERVDVIISSVTDNPTVTVTFADENGVAIIDPTNFTNLADGTNHIMLATKATADFDMVPVNGNITCTVDPSADPGGAAQELTVDIIFYGP